MNQAVGLKALISAALGAFSLYLAELVVPIIVLIVFMALDYCTGMYKAYITKTLSSKIGARGIFKKVGYLVVICVGMGADWLIAAGLDKVGVPFPVTYLIGAMVIVWLILNEMLSILENLSVIGVPMPGFLVKIVKKLKQHEEEDGGDFESEIK